MKDLKNEVKEKQRKSLIDEKEIIYNIRSNKEDLLIDSEYHSDDLERGAFKNYRADNSDFIKNDDILYSSKVRCKRIIIEFTMISLLFSIIFLFGYFFLIKRSFLDIMIILQSKTTHFHSGFISMYGIWLLVSSN